MAQHHKTHKKSKKNRSRWLDLVFVFGLAFMFFAMLSFMIGSSSFMLFGTIITKVDTDEKVVALTFDDGPLPKNTEETLDALEREKVKATFFIIGRDAKRNPAQLKKIIVAGHEVGNHSYSHKNMALMSSDEITSEIESNDTLIRSAGYKGYIPFRVPYNVKFVTLPYYLMTNNRPDISRNVITKEGSSRASGKIVDDIVKQVTPGSIILLHAMYDHTKTTRQAIGPLVKQLKAKGYKFVTVSELLKYRK